MRYICDNCNKYFTKSKNQAGKYHNFCCRNCVTEYKRAHIEEYRMPIGGGTPLQLKLKNMSKLYQESKELKL